MARKPAFLLIQVLFPCLIATPAMAQNPLRSSMPEHSPPAQTAEQEQPKANHRQAEQHNVQSTIGGAEELQTEFSRTLSERSVRLADILNETERKYRGGDLDAAEVLADFACKLFPDQARAQQVRAGIYFARQTRVRAAISSGGEEESGVDIPRHRPSVESPPLSSPGSGGRMVPHSGGPLRPRLWWPF